MEFAASDELCYSLLAVAPKITRNVILGKEWLSRVNGNLQFFFDCMPAGQSVVVDLASFDTGEQLVITKPVTISPKVGHIRVLCPTNEAKGGIKIRWHTHFPVRFD